MRRTRRITALFAVLLLANLIRVGSGFACVMPMSTDAMGSMDDDAAATSNVAAGGMADMPGMAAPARDANPAHQDMPCKFPWAPDGCQLMTPCAPIAMASFEVSIQLPNAAPLAPDQLVVLTPPSAVRSPDLPPPRA